MILPKSPFEIYYLIVITNILRYVIIAGLAFLVFYVIRRKKIAFSKIQPKFPQNKDYLREIGYSFLTFLIFGLVAMMLYNPWVRPYTHTYFNVSDYGWGYLILSFFLTLIIHDTYFYWMHRLMHHPKMFKLFHKVHHQSTNPSPWAAFAFQPSEAFFEAGIFVIFAFTLPLHFSVIVAFLFFMTAYNVYGHLGWELYPKGFNKNFLGKWLNTSVNHNMHHHYFKENYGLYFTFWDEMMHTTHPKYHETFEEVTGRN
jgi:Delta7-sterol 5-desaturase